MVLHRYYRILSLMETRFPISRGGDHIQLAFAWFDAFRSARVSFCFSALPAPGPGCALLPLCLFFLHSPTCSREAAPWLEGQRQGGMRRHPVACHACQGNA